MCSFGMRRCGVFTTVGSSTDAVACRGCGGGAVRPSVSRRQRTTAHAATTVHVRTDDLRAARALWWASVVTSQCHQIDVRALVRERVGDRCQHTLRDEVQ